MRRKILLPWLIAIAAVLQLAAQSASTAPAAPAKTVAAKPATPAPVDKAYLQSIWDGWAAADIDKQAEMKGQIGFVAKVHNGLRRLVIVEDGKILLAQIADELAMLVGRNEQYIHFVDARANGEHRAGLGIVGSGRAIIGGRSGRAAGIGRNGVGIGLSESWANERQCSQQRENPAGRRRVLHAQKVQNFHSTHSLSVLPTD